MAGLKLAASGRVSEGRRAESESESESGSESESKVGHANFIASATASDKPVAASGFCA